MTNAIAANIMNNLTEALNTSVKPAVTSDLRFNNASENEPMTLGDLKNTLLNGDSSDNISSFKEILAKATREANVESSLDLTLARDISEIVNQLKESINTDDKAVLTAEITNDDEEDAVLAEDTEISNTDMTNTESNSENKKSVIPAIFEQVLTVIENIGEISSTPVGEAAAEAVEVIKTAVDNNNVADSLLSNNDIEEETAELVSKFVNDEEDVEEIGTSLELDEDMIRDLNIESIKAEVDSGSEDSLLNKQTPEEYGIKLMLHTGNDKVSVNFTDIQSKISKPQAVDISPEKIIEQITKHLDNLKSGSKISMVLNPEALGKVNIEMANTKEGLTVQFTVTTQDARDLIMKGLDGLKETLLTNGIGVDNVSVKINETEESSYNQDWTEQEGSQGGNKGHQNPDRNEKEKGLFEKTIAKSMKNKEVSI